MAGCRDAGWDVAFACAAGPGAKRLQELGFEHLPLAVARRPSPVSNGRALVALARELRRRHPTIVHTHTPIAGLVGRFAAQLAGCRRIVHTFHGLPFGPDESGIRASAYLALERLAARHTRLFFSQSEGDAVRATQLGIARNHDLRVIGNGVDLTRFRSDPEERRRVREELRIADTDVLVLFVGRLVREKGVLDLADAAAALKDQANLVFLIAGDALPSDRDPAVNELARHPVEAILGDRWRRLGYRADIDRYLKAADILTLPSYREGLPRSVIEAMACAIPVIASDIPACRELVVPDQTGLLVPPRRPDALASALRRLALDRETRRAMGAAARARAEERHDEDRVVAAQIRAFEGLR
jgi:glycosyltransferase involved in cell wall biosynthesis